MVGPGQDDFLQEPMMEDVDPENLGQRTEDSADQPIDHGGEEMAARATTTSQIPDKISCCPPCSTGSGYGIDSRSHLGKRLTDHALIGRFYHGATGR